MSTYRDIESRAAITLRVGRSRMGDHPEIVGSHIIAVSVVVCWRKAYGPVSMCRRRCEDTVVIWLGKGTHTPLSCKDVSPIDSRNLTSKEERALKREWTRGAVLIIPENAQVSE